MYDIYICICTDIVTYGTLFTYFLHILSAIDAPSQLMKALTLITFRYFMILKPIFALFLLCYFVFR